jgi:hypothetical protein
MRSTFEDDVAAVLVKVQDRDLSIAEGILEIEKAMLANLGMHAYLHDLRVRMENEARQELARRQS